MSKGTTPRAIRVSDELWQEAKSVTERRSETISEVVRVALERYTTTPDEFMPPAGEVAGKHPARH